MGFVRPWLAALAISTCFWARSAVADEDKPPPPIPPHRIVYENLFGGRVNPIGLENQFALSYKARLYDGGDSLALRENYFGIGISPTISPAITRFGGHIEVRPLTVLALQGGFYQVGYLGSFGSLQSFPDASFDYSDTRLDELEELEAPRKNYPTNGYEVHLRALGLAKLGPVAFRSDTNAYYTDVRLRAGARYSVADSFVDGADDPSATMRLGPLVAYTFFDEPGASFNRPTLIGIFQWWLVHPYRTGEDSSQGLPYIALAFRFDGELWRSD
ncbi:MAG: hypothetical protein HOV80_12135 [Polyangiaceae bacterium]|nr:hypothetical protein [Polyangiaceae bacterium]